MIKHTSNSGYTIVEALVVIVITGLIMVTAMTIMDGRQEQIQFEQGVRTLDADIRSVANDVSTGHFPDDEFGCNFDEGSNQLIIDTSNQGQGTRPDCVFLGKLISPASGGERIQISTIVGHRQGTDLTSAHPQAVDTSDISLTIDKENRWGLSIDSLVVQNDNDPPVDIMYFGFLSSLLPEGDDSGSGSISGNAEVQTYYGTTAVDLIDSGNQESLPVRLTQSETIYMCLTTPDDKKAVIMIGRDSEKLTTTVDQDPSGKYDEQCGT